MSRLDPYESLGFHCGLTFKAFISSVERGLKGTGVSPAQFLCACAPDGPRPAVADRSEVERLSITKATGVRLVDRMERDGWVVRQPDPADGRIKRGAGCYTEGGRSLGRGIPDGPRGTGEGLTGASIPPR